MGDMNQFQQQLLRRLWIWSVFSMLSGFILARLRRPFWRGLGHQFMGWGLVDGLIALLGLAGISRRRAKPVGEAALAPASTDQVARNLAVLLAVNTALDVGYVAGGAQTLRKRGAQDQYWQGAGWGIILQGGFLFGFDLIHLWLVLRSKK